jgi:phage FluMu protein Com
VNIERRNVDDRREDPRAPVPGRREADAEASTFVREREWEQTRCRECGRLLCKNTRDALKPSQMIEIKCGGCNVLNYIVGRLDVA